MDIKEIALKICRGMNPYSDLHESEFIYFANKLIESYKAELLKEVGEPVAQADGYFNHACELGELLYTSDQVAAAVLKATKPLEERICDLTACKWPDAYTVIPVKINGQLHATSQAIRDEINSLRAKLTAAQEALSVAECDLLSYEDRNKDLHDQCPVCGFYCTGNGGNECIDKPSLIAVGKGE